MRLWPDSKENKPLQGMAPPNDWSAEINLWSLF